MWSHLRTSHPDQYALGASKRSKSTSSVKATPKRKSATSDQPQLPFMFERRTPYSKDSSKWKSITDKLTVMIPELMLPFSIVDEPVFKDLLSELDANRYVLPDRKYMSNTAIPDKYNQVKSQVLSDIKESRYVSLTSDGWSSGTMDPFLSITVHLIKPSWTLRSYCLRTIYMPQSHSGENIAAMIRNVVREYDIELVNCVSITTDSGRNMVKACDDLPMVRIPCFGHILHNGITTSTKQDKIVETVKSVRSVVTTFSHSGKLKLELKKQQKEKGLSQKGLVGEVATRWGSKYRMIERLYYNREPVQAILMSDRKFAKHNPTWDHLQYMETFLATLKPFAALTDALSNSKSVTISKVWPMIKLVEKSCSEAIEADVSDECKNVSKDIQSSLWEYVESRYKEADRNGKLFRLLKLCKYLDPRLAERDDEITGELVIQAVAAELECEGNEDAESGTQANVAEGEDLEVDGHEKQDLMDLLINVSSQSRPHQDEDADTRARKEIEYYLQSAPTMISKNDDLLAWWGNKGNQFPMISNVARKYLTANATSTASERLFSYAGMVVSKKRRSLKPEKVDQLTCLAFNLRALKD